MKPFNTIRNFVRQNMRHIAIMLNKITGNSLSPNIITILGLLAHVPIAWLIAIRHPLWAALFLVIFGLFDTLDGEIARSQNKTTALGMFLDSTTDRIKEIMLYCGMAIFMIDSGASKTTLVVLVAALGISVLTSYLNAWGEVVLAHYSKTKLHQINQTFRSGLLSFDIRMALIIIGLVSGRLTIVLYVISILGFVTVVQRFINISQNLKNV